MPTTVSPRHVELHFPHGLVKEPVLYHLVKDYHLKPNVLVARVESASGGHLKLDLAGEEENWQRAKAWLVGLGIRLEEF